MLGTSFYSFNQPLYHNVLTPIACRGIHNSDCCVFKINLTRSKCPACKCYYMKCPAIKGQQQFLLKKYCLGVSYDTNYDLSISLSIYLHIYIYISIYIYIYVYI